jgi:hypothetical protein
VTCNFCHGVNQGAGCQACLNATRAAMFFLPLHIEDGGHHFNGGISFPMEPDDEPATPPTMAASWAIYAGIVAALVTFTVWVVQMGVPNWGAR